MSTSAWMSVLKSPFLGLICSTISMPRSRASSSALTMLTFWASRYSSSPAAKAAVMQLGAAPGHLAAITHVVVQGHPQRKPRSQLHRGDPDEEKRESRGLALHPCPLVLQALGDRLVRPFDPVHVVRPVIGSLEVDPECVELPLDRPAEPFVALLVLHQLHAAHEQPERPGRRGEMPEGADHRAAARTASKIFW